MFGVLRMFGETLRYIYRNRGASDIVFRAVFKFLWPFCSRRLLLEPSRMTWVGLLFLGFIAFLPASHAQAQAQTQPPQVQELLRLLQDPAVRNWAEQQKASAATEAVPTDTLLPENASGRLSARIEAVRTHFAALWAAIPTLPAELQDARLKLMQELNDRRPIGIVVLVLAFLGLGAGVEWLFARVTMDLSRRLVASSTENVSGRVRAILSRFALNIAHIAIFSLGSIGAFLAFNWPPLLKQIVIAYLLAVIVLRLVLAGGRLLLAPEFINPQDVEKFRLIPMSDPEARFWYKRVGLFMGWLAFGWVSVDLLGSLGFSTQARELVAYTLGLGLLAIAIETTWSSLRFQHAAEEGLRDATRSPMLGAWLFSLCFMTIWLFWVAGLMGLFWLGVLALLLPKAIAVAERAGHRLLNSPGPSQGIADSSLEAIYLGRGIRALMIIAAAFLLAKVWQIDLVELTSRDTLPIRLLRGLLSSIVILLVVDLIWQLVKTLIDRRLSASMQTALPGSEEALRVARLRTLLPILRKAIFVVLIVVAGLMSLAALGVEIGPLIAGAGVVGIAVGFGAQTLVKDIISGIFYLLDDAFRVGEYIQSGNYKGTVESIGIRSLKLRHQRGPIYTVPFGQLGAVQNMSRDWVIDKMSINVTYDTDFEKVKKVIKQIGLELAQDPEFSSKILEPLKMQGVEQFGDYAIQLRLKMKTRPGEQFVIRRRAFAIIKKRFDENGINFAFPTVQVAGKEDAEHVGAYQALKLVTPAVPE